MTTPGKDYAKHDDHIQINNGVYHGKWLLPGTEGIIKNTFISLFTVQGQYLAQNW
jgi:hypothetical protein